jgi:glycerol-3-phosphate O-acyltransferase
VPATSSLPDRPLADEPGWPSANGRRVILLLDATSGFERRILEGWIARHRPADEGADTLAPLAIPPSRGRRRGEAKPVDPRLEAELLEGDDPLLAPMRVAWFPPARADGSRTVTLPQLLAGGDPRDPAAWRQRWILARAPDRCRIVAGEPAPLSELRERWRAAGGASETSGLVEFVVRQAQLALERAERRLRGARYKVPRLVHEDILARPAFRGALAHLARKLGRDPADVAREAAHDLREIAAATSPTMIDLASQLYRFLYTRGYDEKLRYDAARLEEIAALSQRHPVVFLPTHKSNLDHPVVHCMLYENGLPPNHTAGGINMNFFPIGPLVRRAGVFFIRRSFKDDEVYKLVLRSYVDYLIEKRFSLEWYIEGGRSRSGKLLPPRFGMLAYVVDAYRRGKSDDVFLIPVSIAYDQIQDVGDYVAEQRGARKERESFGWFVRLVRRIQREGRIHIRFGEPLSLAKSLGPPDPSAEPNPDEQSLALQKLAFEVCVRMNEATPITPASLVTLALLGVGDQALSIEETVRSLERIVEYVERRRLPTTGDLELRTPAGVTRALDELVRTDVVTVFREGPEAVYRIADDAHLAAAYYRNTVIHFFVTGAIAELALLFAGGEEGGGERRNAFFEEALRLRDLLKFEFFFPERERFLAELRREVAYHDAEWERGLEGAPDDVFDLVRRFRPLSAHRVARPFLESYRIVADALVREDPQRSFDRGDFLGRCQALGKQYVLQRRIHSAESVSRSYFETGLRLAENRRLLAPAEGESADELASRRRAFAGELTGAVRRIDAIAALAALRRSGVAA